MSLLRAAPSSQPLGSPPSPPGGRRPRAPGQPQRSAPAAPASPGAGGRGAAPLHRPSRRGPREWVGSRRGPGRAGVKRCCWQKSAGKPRGESFSHQATSTSAQVSSTFCLQPSHCENSRAGERAVFPKRAVLPKTQRTGPEKGPRQKSDPLSPPRLSFHGHIWTKARLFPGRA